MDWHLLTFCFFKHSLEFLKGRDSAFLELAASARIKPGVGVGDYRSELERQWAMFFCGETEAWGWYCA